MNNFEVHSRPMLFDRIQVNVTPDYMISKVNKKLKYLKDLIYF
jgi:hypothetical protein